MNTPAHVIASVVAFRAKQQPRSLWPSVFGGEIHDTPMYLFYAYEELTGQPEHVIWSDTVLSIVCQALIITSANAVGESTLARRASEGHYRIT